MKIGNLKRFLEGMDDDKEVVVLQGAELIRLPILEYDESEDGNLSIWVEVGND